jgi:hypothetical protein
MNYNTYWDIDYLMSEEYRQSIVAQGKCKEAFISGFYKELDSLAEKYGYTLPKERVEINAIASTKDSADLIIELKSSKHCTINCYSTRIHKDDSVSTVMSCGALFAKSIYINYVMVENEIPTQPTFVDGSQEIVMHCYHLYDKVTIFSKFVYGLKYKKMVDKFDTHFSILFEDIDQCINCVFEEILPFCYMLNENT